jgi:hypothetical protein
MGEKVKVLKLERDYKKFLYYIDGNGSVCRKPKKAGTDNEAEVLLDKAIVREPEFLYYIDKEGDVARTPMARKSKK